MTDYNLMLRQSLSGGGFQYTAPTVESREYQPFLNRESREIVFSVLEKILQESGPLFVNELVYMIRHTQICRVELKGSCINKEDMCAQPLFGTDFMLESKIAELTYRGEGEPGCHNIKSIPLGVALEKFLGPFTKLKSGVQGGRRNMHIYFLSDEQLGTYIKDHVKREVITQIVLDVTGLFIVDSHK